MLRPGAEVTMGGRRSEAIVATTLQQDFNQPSIQINNNGLTLDCNHASVQLRAVSNASNPQFSWMGNGETFAGQMIQVTQPGSYCCTVTATNGCTSSNCATVSAMGTVIDLQLTLAGNPCAGGEKTLTATVAGGAMPYTYTWSTGATGASTTVPAGFTGLVSLTVTDNNTCNAQSAIVVAAALNVLALATKPSSGSAADGNIDLLVSGGQAPITFLWSNGSATEDISGLISGIYTVTLTDAMGCTKVLSVPLITVGIQEINAGIAVNILPNPVQELMTVQVQNPEGLDITLQLSDLSGRIVALQYGHGDTFFFDTTTITSGMYVLRVGTRWSNQVFKVVVAQ